MPNINFPSSLDTDLTLFKPFTRYKWTSFLKTAVTASAPVLILTDVTDIPSIVAGNYIGIDNEIMLVNSIDNSGAEKKLNVTRAQDDSIAATHEANTEVIQCITAGLHNRLKEAIIALEDYVLAGVPPVITVPLTASPHTYVFTGFIGYNYLLKIAVKNSDGSAKLIKSFVVNQWNDAINTPEALEGMTFTIGAGITIAITGLVANTAAFNIVVTGANGGEMKITVHEKGAIE